VLLVFSVLIIFAVINAGQAQKSENNFSPVIPKTWDDAAVRALEVPLVNPAYSPVHVSSDYYYRMPVRPIYKSYPIYARGKEPSGYLEWLKQQEPEIVFDASKLKTEADWIRAGELVFDAPIGYRAARATPTEPEFDDDIKMPITKDGTIPFLRYVIRKKGVIEVGGNSCANCHTRVFPDGMVVKGAQGNAPVARASANVSRKRAAQGADQGKQEMLDRATAQRRSIGAPWIQPDPSQEFLRSLEESAGAREAVPAGLSIREGTSIRYAAQVPDLIGVKDRRYLDHTGLVRHNSIGDVMRYAALNQDTQLLARYGDFIPGGKDFRELPDPTTLSRYDDEQLYALALYIYSLEPPPNPNKFDALAERGQQVFQSQGCAGCHTPPLYTNNKLTPVEGFTVSEELTRKLDILPRVVGTNPSLALRTRRGTGFYKIPSLRGVWYRGPLQHNGAVATLEDWFDPRRLREDYVPTGYKPYGVKTQAVKGHQFGLQLSAEDKRALIAFLKTL
jgi:mono/diheme cytochrome c family protein